MNKTELVKTEVGQALRTINSREVAEMVGKEHKTVMRDIRKYVTVLEKNIGTDLYPSQFFIESTYVDSYGREKSCYEVTKKGCDMIANKMTGEKGVLFTAAYVTKFEEMEKEIAMKQFNLPTTYKEALLALVAAEEEKELLIAENNKKQELLIAQAPKIDLYNDFMNTDLVYSVNDIAKCLAIKNLGRNNLYKWLRWNKILIEESREAYQSHINAGRIVHKIDKVPFHKYGMVLNEETGKKEKRVIETRYETSIKACFTPKGLEWLYNKLIKDGYVISKTLKEVFETIKPDKENN